MIEWLWWVPGIQPGSTHHIHLQVSAPVHNTGESRGFIGRTCAASMCETGCAGTNTLMGGCSESGVLGGSRVSRPVPGLGSCPP